MLGSGFVLSMAMTASHLRRSMLTHVVSVSVALGATSLACENATAPLLPDEPPEELRFTTAGYGSGFTIIQLKDDVVEMWHVPWLWTSGQPIDTMRTVPTSQEWRNFWIAAERAGVRRWRARYEDRNVADGVAWTFRLVTGDFTLESSGSNAFPDALGAEHGHPMPAEFGALITAMENLALLAPARR